MSLYDIVCVVTNEISYDRRMIRTCTTLSKSGKKVLMIGREVAHKVYNDDFPFDTYRVRCDKQDGPGFYREVLQRFNRFLKKTTYKDLLLTDYDTILLARLQRSKARRIYLDLHEYFEHTPELEGKPLKKSIWKMAAQIGQAKCDVIYTVNNSLANLYAKRFGRDIEVIRNVPSKKTTAAQVPKRLEVPLIRTVYLGVLNPGRGLKELITAIELSADIHLTIIGDGPLRESLEALVNDPLKVTFLGMVPPDEIAGLLGDKDLGWNLLYSHSKSYYYSLANKFFDYVHHDVPVVTMDFPEYRDLLAKYPCGTILPELSVQSISDVLEMVRVDREHLRKWKEACPLLAEEYNWEHESKKLLALFG